MGKVKQEIQMFGLWPGLVTGGCFLLGGIVGCLFGAVASGEIAQQLSEYLADYISLVGDGQISWSVPAVLWNRGRWLVVCVLAGMTGLGVALLPALFGLRGFLAAFGVSCFVRVFGGEGLIPALLLFGVPALLWAPGFFLTGSLGVVSSVRLLRLRRGEGSALPETGWNLRTGAMLSGLLLVLCVMFECGVLPVLLPLAAQMLG